MRIIIVLSLLVWILFFMVIGVLCFLPCFNCVLHCCSWLLVLYWMGCLRIKHHLAAKFWTKPSAFAAYVIFTVCGWFTFWGVFFWGVFYCAIFIICWWYSFYKNLMWGAPVVASSATGTSCPLFCPFLSWFWLFITCDWIVLAVGIFMLRCKRVVSMYYCCFGLYYFVVDFWSEEIFTK